MAQKKQSFRFRIPWLSGAPAARPAAEPLPRRSKDRKKSPPQPDTHVPIHRPPPSPPPPPPPPPTQQTQGAPRAEPQQQSPPPPHRPETSSVIVEFPVTFQPEQPSPSTSPTEFHSPLTSPSPSPASSPAPVSFASSSQRLDSGLPMEEPKRAAEESTALPAASSASEQEKEKRVVSEPMPQESASSESSTTHLDSGPAIEVTKLAVSASEQEKDKRVVSEPMAKESASPPSHLDSGAMEVRKPAAEESTALPLASSASEQEKVVSEPMPQEPEPMVKSPETEASFQPERMSTQTQPAGPESRVSSSSVPSSPISKAEPTSQPQPSSSHLAPERTSEVSEPTPEESALPASSASQEPASSASSQEEKGNMAASEPVSQEPEPTVKSPLKTIPKSPETSSQPEPEKIAARPAGIVKDEERSTTLETKKMELDTHSPTGTESSKAPLETQSSKFQQSEEKEKVVQEPIKTEKDKDTMTGTKAEVHTKASASGTKKSKDPFSRQFKKQHEVRETVERKMMFATSRPSGKDIRVVSSSADPETRNVSSSISLEKPVLVHVPLQKGIKDDISKFVHKLGTVHPTEPMDDDTDDRAASVITLAGDNRGATMQIGFESAANKEESIHIQRVYETDPEESIETEVTSDAEGNTSSTENDEVGKAYVNSNIQSINNSMMFHGSVYEGDPGVLMIPPQKPAEPIKPVQETRKAEFTISRAEKLTYQPTVPRRCLRGLFLEPSESDQDNPDKPRRHVCKFSCGDV